MTRWLSTSRMQDLQYLYQTMMIAIMTSFTIESIYRNLLEDLPWEKTKMERYTPQILLLQVWRKKTNQQVNIRKYTFNKYYILLPLPSEECLEKYFNSFGFVFNWIVWSNLLQWSLLYMGFNFLNFVKVKFTMMANDYIKIWYYILYVNNHNNYKINEHL